MSGRPKFSVFRAWVEPPFLKKTNGDRLRLLSSPEVDAAKERTTNIKVAWFLGVVALLFLLADYIGRVKNGIDANLGADSTERVSLTLSPPVKKQAGFSVRFRLSNRENHCIFYPTSRTSSAPIGELVARTPPSPEWMRSFGSSKGQGVLAVQESTDSSLAWIEMPPGGWVDGEFHDAGEPPEEHAYVIYVKTARDANGIRVVSKSYASPRN
jgi:hypothetical protein